MENTAYILITIIILAIIMVILFVRAKKAGKQLRTSSLLPIAILPIIGGIIISDNAMSYNLFALGLVIVLVDIFRRRKNRDTNPN